MPDDTPEEQDVDVKESANHGVNNSYEKLQTVHTELDLVKCSGDIENLLLEASLEEYQFVISRKIINMLDANRTSKAVFRSTGCGTVAPRLTTV
jgi:hypothetical protein